MTRTFWQELVLGLVVVVLAGYWISGAFAPNKDAQSALADNTGSSLSTVNTVSGSSAPYTVMGSDVISTVSGLCKADNADYAVVIVDNVGANSSTYTTSATSASSGINVSILSKVSNTTDWYTRSQTTVGALTTITFKKV